jgi:hypothetical protein
MPTLLEAPDRIEVRSPMRAGTRIVLALLGLFPLLAPYELLIRVGWQEFLNPFFLLAALISAGAVAISLFLFYAAVAGLNSRMVFDGRLRTFTYSEEAPLVRRRTAQLPLSSLERIEVGRREWSDGSPTFHLRVVGTGGQAFESGPSWTRQEIERLADRVGEFLIERAAR